MVIDQNSIKVAWVVVILLVVVIKLSHIALRGPLARLPGPWYTRFTSAVYTYHQVRGQAPVYVHKLHAKYGQHCNPERAAIGLFSSRPIVRTTPHEADVSDPAAVQAIYRIKGEFLKSPWYDSLALGAPNVFNATDPIVHRRRRRLLSQPLSDTGLRGLIPVIDGKIQKAIDRMAWEMKDRGAADMYKWWLFMATDIIGALSFGDCFRMLDKGEKNQYVIDLESTGDTFMVRAAFPSLTGWIRKVPVPFVPLASLKAANEVECRTMNYAHESLQWHRRLVEENPETAVPTLFSKFYNDTTITAREMAVDAQAYIIGGSDTLSKTLTYLVWAVCRNPSVKEKLVREIQQRLPLASQQRSGITDAQVRDLPYLAMVIEETLRLYPAVPSALPRVPPELCGRRLPAGATVTTSAYCLHRDPMAFPGPERFVPERWQNPTKRMKDAFMAFGGGSRVCLGMHLARLEIRLAAARFFHRFPDVEISSLEGMSDDDMEAQWYFVLTPKGKRCLIQQARA
ncbi:Cytochrome P450 monooxygenase azaI [Apiospora aurea]|uniref:Cytochrome P450 monooxygenase azaI n=1 Tax=Apiospora aurea TaxID=335848 RepID=A0ABR1Q543_9PEZI